MGYGCGWGWGGQGRRGVRLHRRSRVGGRCMFLLPAVAAASMRAASCSPLLSMECIAATKCRCLNAIAFIALLQRCDPGDEGGAPGLAARARTRTR